jgi:hypothetical protein
MKCSAKLPGYQVCFLCIPKTVCSSAYYFYREQWLSTLLIVLLYKIYFIVSASGSSKILLFVLSRYCSLHILPSKHTKNWSEIIQKKICNSAHFDSNQRVSTILTILALQNMLYWFLIQLFQAICMPSRYCSLHFQYLQHNNIKCIGPSHPKMSGIR